jgi:transaldolase
MVAEKMHAVAKSLLGKGCYCNAKMSYQIYKEVFNEPRFKALANKGAQVQRLLWASTGSKNPNYSDVMYIETLIGPDTVNTVPIRYIKSLPGSWPAGSPPGRRNR